MKNFIPFFILFILSGKLYSQEVGFFQEIQCEPSKPDIGHKVQVKFFRELPLIKFFEFEKKKNKTEVLDMFPATILEAHVFLSQKYCQFHVISKRPSVNSFHFVMNVESLMSKDIHTYQGPAHFNFLVDEVSPQAKEHKLVNCQITGLKLPGYYFHSCKKKKDKPKKIKYEGPIRTKPKYPYYRDIGVEPQQNNNTGTRSGSK